MSAALLIGVIFGIAPAWQATSISASEAMGADSRTTTGGGGRLRNLLVTGEVATAVLLLFGAGLLLRTLIAVESFDRGYRAESVLTMVVDPLGSSYPTPEKLQQFFDQVEARSAVGSRRRRTWRGRADCRWATRSSASIPFTYEMAGDAPLDEAQRPTTNYQLVSPTYFSTLELPIRRRPRVRRAATPARAPASPLSTRRSRAAWAARSPIGMRVSFKAGRLARARPGDGSKSSASPSR